jgi:hypothetical protein
VKGWQNGHKEQCADLNQLKIEGKKGGITSGDRKDPKNPTFVFPVTTELIFIQEDGGRGGIKIKRDESGVTYMKFNQDVTTAKQLMATLKKLAEEEGLISPGHMSKKERKAAKKKAKKEKKRSSSSRSQSPKRDESSSEEAEPEPVVPPVQPDTLYQSLLTAGSNEPEESGSGSGEEEGEGESESIDPNETVFDDNREPYAVNDIVMELDEYTPRFMKRIHPNILPTYKPSPKFVHMLTQELWTVIENDRHFEGHILGLLHNYKGTHNLLHDAIEAFFLPSEKSLSSSSHGSLKISDLKDFLSLELNRFIEIDPRRGNKSMIPEEFIEYRNDFRTFLSGSMNPEQTKLLNAHPDLLDETLSAREVRPAKPNAPVVEIAKTDEEAEEEEEKEEAATPSPSPSKGKSPSASSEEERQLAALSDEEYIKVPGESIQRAWEINNAKAFVQKELILEFFKDKDIRVPDQVKRLRGLPTTPAEEKRFRSEDEVTQVARGRKSENERRELVKDLVAWLKRRTGIERARSRQLVWYHRQHPEFLREQLEEGLNRILERKARIPGPTFW